MKYEKESGERKTCPTEETLSTAQLIFSYLQSNRSNGQSRIYGKEGSCEGTEREIDQVQYTERTSKRIVEHEGDSTRNDVSVINGQINK